MKKKILISVSVLLISFAMLFAFLSYNISQKRIYRVYWAGVTAEFLIQAKTNPAEFKITKEPSIIIIDNRPDATENYYSLSELADFTNKGEFFSVHLFTFEQYQKQPFFSMGPETKKKRTKQQIFFFGYLLLSLVCFGGATILFLKSKK